MSDFYTEEHYENSLIELFEGMGYRHVYGPDVERDYTCPLYMEELDEALVRLNPTLPPAAIQEARRKLLHFENGSLVQQNAVFMDYLQNGIAVKYFDGKESHTPQVYLADFVHSERNSFVVANQWTFSENSTKRPDILLFLNGLPVVLMELKSPSREETDASEAYRQIRNYMQEIPSMFIYNAVCVMSDMMTSARGRSPPGKTVSWSGRRKTGAMRIRSTPSLTHSLRGCFRRHAFWIF